jgi:hypothetical protein
MTKAKRVLVGLLFSVFWIEMAQANEFEFLGFDVYAGGGLSYNSLSGRFQGVEYDAAVGLQGFAGWNIFRVQQLTVAGEVGVFTTGSFSHDFGSSGSYEGVYVNGLAKYDLSDTVWLQGRAGHNLSDTGAGMIGGGIGYRVTPTIAVRLEAARYGSVTSLFRVDALMTF